MKKIIAIVGVLGIFIGGVATSQAAYFNTEPAFNCPIKITRNLSSGASGEEVYILQGFLSRAGYLSAIPNGNFGPQTRSAVQAFQRDNYISRTGTVGPSTRDALNERLCDVDVHAESSSYYGGYSTGVTYVDPVDPFVQVISPRYSSPTVYDTPSNSYVSSYQPVTVNQSPAPTYSQPIIPVSTNNYNNQIQSTNIIYSPSIGYTYGITPAPGSLTITSPTTNVRYNEGETVNVSWTTNNLASNNQYQIILESTNTKQNRIVSVVSGNSASFVLSHELLESVCSGTCSSYNYNQTGQYNVVIATPVTDITGKSSMFMAKVQVTVTRPLTYTGTANISPNKTPVNSGESFRLYVNLPHVNTYYGSQTNLSFRIRAICPQGVTVNIAGTYCGQEFTVPFSYSSQQQQIPVMIFNTSYYSQDVTFEIATYGPNGQEIGKSQAKVTVNPATFGY